MVHESAFLVKQHSTNIWIIMIYDYYKEIIKIVVNFFSQPSQLFASGNNEKELVVQS